MSNEVVAPDPGIGTRVSGAAHCRADLPHRRLSSEVDPQGSHGHRRATEVRGDVREKATTHTLERGVLGCIRCRL